MRVVVIVVKFKNLRLYWELNPGQNFQKYHRSMLLALGYDVS